METLNKKKKPFKMPHVFLILLGIMLFVTVLGYIIPAGEFERIASEDPSAPSVINPDKFQFVDRVDPIGVFDFFNSIYTGLVEAGIIIFSTLIGAGTIEVFNETGALRGGIAKLNKATHGNSVLGIIIFFLFFNLMNVVGGGETLYPFYPVCVAILCSLGYDKMVGTGVVVYASTAGFACGVINLFTTGISQKIVGLPLFSGAGYRFIVLIVLSIIGLISILRYAAKTKANPDKSIMAEDYKKQLAEDAEKGEETIIFGIKEKLALMVFIISNIFVGYGCLKLGFDFPEMATVNIIMAIIVATIYGYGPSSVCKMFIRGVEQVIIPMVALGLARAVMVLLTQSQILDTMVHYMGNAMTGKSAVVTLLLVFIFVTLFNFLVASGSGKALIFMPILGPLGKVLGINQQVMVLAYQLGDGLTNSFWPGGGLVTSSLCGVDYGKYMKLIWKTVLLMIAAAFVMIVIANAMDYGPF